VQAHTHARVLTPTCLCLQASTHACGNLSAWLASLAGPCGSLPGGSRFAPLGTCVPCCWRGAAPWVAYAPLRRTYTLVGISYSLYMGLWGSPPFLGRAVLEASVSHARARMGARRGLLPFLTLLKVNYNTSRP